MAYLRQAAAAAQVSKGLMAAAASSKGERGEGQAVGRTVGWGSGTSRKCKIR